MKFNIDDITVYFPYDFIYPEQLDYMRKLKTTIDCSGHSILEMPTGTGKTVALFSLITSYQLAKPEIGKLIYCTRTVPEMEKALLELRNVIVNRHKQNKQKMQFENDDKQILGVALSARRNYCINENVIKLVNRDKIDEACRKLTAPWILKNKDIEESGCDTCKYYENFMTYWNPSHLPANVYTIDELKQIAKNYVFKKSSEDLTNIDNDESEGGGLIGFCPYFAARRLINIADVVVLNYKYLLDPKCAKVAFNIESEQYRNISDLFTRDEQMDSQEREKNIVVMDEAHNIDSICLESFSVNINFVTLEKARNNIQSLDNILNKVKHTRSEALRLEYERLVKSIRESIYDNPSLKDLSMEMLENPVLAEDAAKEAIPGSIRKAEFFIHYLFKLISHLKSYMRILELKVEGTLSFLRNFEVDTGINSKVLKFTYERLKSLLTTLEIVDLDKYTPLTIITDFYTLAGTYSEGFVIITDPYPDVVGVYEPLLELACLDSSIAIRPILKNHRSVILTSGTISPLNLYPKLLNFEPTITQSFPMSLDRNCICPLIVTKGGDQVMLSSSFALREDISILNNYANLIINLCSTIPDGIVCFFTSYAYMEDVLGQW